MPFLINGIFFQRGQSLGLGMDRESGETRVFVSQKLQQTIYYGVIWENPQLVLGGFSGIMHDFYGESTLSNIRISDSEVRFDKKYVQRHDTICYSFKQKDGNVWAGEYNGDMVGSGTSRCVVTEVLDSFFDPQSLAERLGRQSPHEWPDWSKKIDEEAASRAIARQEPEEDGIPPLLGDEDIRSDDVPF